MNWIEGDRSIAIPFNRMALKSPTHPAWKKIYNGKFIISITFLETGLLTYTYTILPVTICLVT